MPLLILNLFSYKIYGNLIIALPNHNHNNSIFSLFVVIDD